MKILLHICCSNCALYPVKIMRSEGHDFTGFWYNPNIQPFDEYKLRLDSLKSLSGQWHIEMLYDDEYKPGDYLQLFSNNDSNSPDGSISRNSLEIPPFPERCRSCYLLRLEKTAEQAQKLGYDAFTTTLLISPYQDFKQITSTGKALAEKYNVNYYSNDFRPYYRKAMNLSKELGLYRQKYCGCIFSSYERTRGKSKKHK